MNEEPFEVVLKGMITNTVSGRYISSTQVLIRHLIHKWFEMFWFNIFFTLLLISRENKYVVPTECYAQE